MPSQPIWRSSSEIMPSHISEPKLKSHPEDSTSVLRQKDKFSKQKRSWVMSRIKSKNTKLDLTMKSLLLEKKIEFEMYPKMIGAPDFLLSSKLVLFCDSGFWHGRNWTKLRKQLARGNDPEYWVRHIAKNRKRDRKVNKLLREEGYLVLRVWDEEINKFPEKSIQKIEKALSQLTNL